MDDDRSIGFSSVRLSWWQRLRLWLAARRNSRAIAALERDPNVEVQFRVTEFQSLDEWFRKP